MLEKFKRWRWKLNTRRNYDESKDLTNLVYKCIWLMKNCPTVNVTITQYEIIITTTSSYIILWNENKFHGWLSNGSVNGVKYNRLSPSLDAMYDFNNYLEQCGYDIYVSEKPDTIDLSNIKC